MDESTFQRELNKYKVVRPADYHKSRTIKAKSDPKSGARPAALTGTAPSPAPAPTPISRSAEVDFWELLSASNSTFMSTADSIKFIEILKEVIHEITLFLCLERDG